MSGNKHLIGTLYMSSQIKVLQAEMYLFIFNSKLYLPVSYEVLHKSFYSV